MERNSWNGRVRPVDGEAVIAVDASLDHTATGIYACAYLSSTGHWGAYVKAAHTEVNSTNVAELYAIAHGVTCAREDRLALRVLTDSQMAYETVQRWQEGEIHFRDGELMARRFGNIGKLKFLQKVVQEQPGIRIEKITRNSHPLHDGADVMARIALRSSRKTEKERRKTENKLRSAAGSRLGRLREECGGASLYQDLMRQAVEGDPEQRICLYAAAAKAAETAFEHRVAMDAIRELTTAPSA